VLRVNTVTPPNAPPDISYLLPRDDTVAHSGMTIGGHGYSGHEIIAAADGVVGIVNFGERGSYHVRIHHGVDNDKAEIYTEYFHVYELVVKTGDSIKRGQRIGSIRRQVRSHGTVHYHYLVVRKTENVRGFSPLNPHDYWLGIDQYKMKLDEGAALGPFLIPCFNPNAEYHKETVRFTYPVRCN
jgi:Membrane proteins related to metalloendopeptidases